MYIDPSIKLFSSLHSNKLSNSVQTQRSKTAHFSWAPHWAVQETLHFTEIYNSHSWWPVLVLPFCCQCCPCWFLFFSLITSNLCIFFWIHEYSGWRRSSRIGNWWLLLRALGSKRWPNNRLDHITAANVPTSVNLSLLAHWFSMRCRLVAFLSVLIASCWFAASGVPRTYCNSKWMTVSLCCFWMGGLVNSRMPEFSSFQEIFQEVLGALDILWVKISSHGVRSGGTTIFAAEAGCWCWFRWWPLLRHHWTWRATRRCSTEEEKMSRGGSLADCALGPGAQRGGAYRHKKGGRCRVVPWLSEMTESNMV